eukprot:snap_masked-scaffold_14-processed-gene-10.33-mRNA-1 protein AED:1.00 eAED:1.00 QI:0/-1/0/0/-1/1/1/0/393
MRPMGFYEKKRASPFNNPQVFLYQSWTLFKRNGWKICLAVFFMLQVFWWSFPLFSEDHTPKIVQNFKLPISSYEDYVTPQSKIDVVYTYVNGSDPLWLNNKAKYKAPKENRFTFYNNHQNDPNRYKDNSELKYSLRAIQKHFSQVNKIHIVVALESQVPLWLNTSHPKINIVLHEDIFTGEFREFLPVFNSRTIELQLHKIPNLADNYIYLNDDFIIGQDIGVDNFYTKETGAKIYMDKKLTYRTHYFKTILKKYGMGKGQDLRVPSHVPYFFNKKITGEVFNFFREEMVYTSKTKFRAYDTIQMQFSYQMYLIENNDKFKSTSYIFSENSTYLQVIDDESKSYDKKMNRFFHNPTTFFVLQDDDVGTGKAKEKVYQRLRNMFPTTSSYEKQV